MKNMDPAAKKPHPEKRSISESEKSDILTNVRQRSGPSVTQSADELHVELGGSLHTALIGGFGSPLLTQTLEILSS